MSGKKSTRQGFVSCNYLSPFEGRKLKEEINRRKYHWISLDPKLLILRSKLTMHLINIVGSFIPNFKEYKEEEIDIPKHPFEDIFAESEDTLFEAVSVDPLGPLPHNNKPAGVIIDRSLWSIFDQAAIDAVFSCPAAPSAALAAVTGNGHGSKVVPMLETNAPALNNRYEGRWLEKKEDSDEESGEEEEDP